MRIVADPPLVRKVCGTDKRAPYYPRDSVSFKLNFMLDY
jgi:hypothetical protein